MIYDLFLDDIRLPNYLIDSRAMIVARTFDQAVELVKTLGVPDRLFLDHDLGRNEKTGMDFVKWLADYIMEHDLELPSNFQFNVHSANPVGKSNMLFYLRSFVDYWTKEKRG